MPMTFLSPYLTKAQGEALAKQQELTYPGMAHWAGSGPAGKTCRECDFWGSEGQTSFKRDEGLLRKVRCRRFTRAMQGIAGAGVPPTAQACNKFEQREVTPLLQIEYKPRG